MSDLKNFFQIDGHHNTPGFFEFLFIEDNSVSFIPPPVSGIVNLNDLVYGDDNTWFRGYATDSTLFLGDKGKIGSSGTLRSVQISGSTPLVNNHNLDLFEKMSRRRYIVLVRDKNNNWFIAGEAQNGLQFEFERKGAGLDFTFSAEYPHPCWKSMGDVIVDQREFDITNPGGIILTPPPGSVLIRVGLNLPDELFDVTVDSVTTEGYLTAEFKTKNKNLVFASDPEHDGHKPEFRPLVTDDMPGLDSFVDDKISEESAFALMMSEEISGTLHRAKTGNGDDVGMLLSDELLGLVTSLHMPGMDDSDVQDPGSGDVNFFYSSTYSQLKYKTHTSSFTLETKEHADATFLPLAGGTMSGNILFASLLGIDTATNTGSLYVGAVNAKKVYLGTGSSNTEINIGTSGTNVIQIGNSNSTVNILGTVLYENVTNLQVSDKLITLNKGGSSNSAGGSGIEFEEAASITGYFKVTGGRDGFLLRAPSWSNDISFISSPSASRSFTFPDVSGTVGIIISGYGTNTYHAKFNASGNLVDSIIKDDGSRAFVSGELQVGSTLGYTLITQGNYFTKGGGSLFTGNVLAGSSIHKIINLQRNDGEKMNIGLDAADNFAIINSSGNVMLSLTSTGNLSAYGSLTQGSVTSAMLKANGSGILVSATTGTDYWSPSDFSSTDISHWNSAYGWGDHASYGYAHLSGSETFTGAKTFNQTLQLNVSSGTAWLEQSATTSPVKILHIGMTGTDAYIGVAGSSAYLISGSAAYDMIFRNDSGYTWGNGSSKTMRLDSSGALDVVGSGTFGGNVTINDTGTPLTFKYNSSYTHYITTDYSSSAALNYISFNVASGSGTHSTDALKITGDGNTHLGGRLYTAEYVNIFSGGDDYLYLGKSGNWEGSSNSKAAIATARDRINFYTNNNATIKAVLDGSGNFSALGTLGQGSVASAMLKANGSGILVSATTGTDYWSPSDFSSTDISHWNSAYSWGDHSAIGYITGGSLSSGYVPKWNGSSLVNSIISEASTKITVTGALKITDLAGTGNRLAYADTNGDVATLVIGSGLTVNAGALEVNSGIPGLTDGYIPYADTGTLGNSLIWFDGSTGFGVNTTSISAMWHVNGTMYALSATFPDLSVTSDFELVQTGLPAGYNSSPNSATRLYEKSGSGGHYYLGEPDIWIKIKYGGNDYVAPLYLA